jgi:hypothetical protein
MQTALTLLIMAMTLLTTVRNSPNLSPEFVIKAENVAQTAIDYAQNIINEQSTPTTQSIQTPETPLTFGSVSCIENPVLTLATTSIWDGTGTRMNIDADYSTGCPLNPQTTWSYTGGTGMEDNGTIGKGSIYGHNSWETFSTDNDIFHISLYEPNPNIQFSLTVGSTTKNF